VRNVRMQIKSRQTRSHSQENVVSFSSMLTAVDEKSFIPLPEFLTHCRIANEVRVFHKVHLSHSHTQLYLREGKLLFIKTKKKLNSVA
jgi:hypothetical protein